MADKAKEKSKSPAPAASVANGKKDATPKPAASASTSKKDQTTTAPATTSAATTTMTPAPTAPKKEEKSSKKEEKSTATTAAASSPTTSTPKSDPKKAATAPTGKEAPSSSKDSKNIKEAKESTPEPRPEEVNENPYIEVLAHRQRALRKRLTKIEKNEESKAQGNVLDKDQLASIAQKQEVQDLIHELDDLIKNLGVVAVEQDKEAKKQAKLRKIEESKLAQIAKEQNQEEVKKLLEFLYILHAFGQEDVREHFVSGQVEGFSLTKEQIQTLDNLNSSLFPTYESSIGLAKISTELHQKVNRLFAKGKDDIAPGLNSLKTFTILSAIASSSYFNLEVAARLAKEKADAEAAAAERERRRLEEEAAAAERARREQEEMQNSYELIDPAEVPPSRPLSRDQINGQPAPTLAFMNESELLGGEFNLGNFEQSPAVVVPVPQAIFETHGGISNIPMGIVPPVLPKGAAWGKPTATSTTTTSSSSSTPASQQQQQQDQHTTSSSHDSQQQAQASSQEPLASDSGSTATGASEDPSSQQNEQQLDKRQQNRGPRNSHHNNPNPNAGGVSNRGGRGGYRNYDNNNRNYNNYPNNNAQGQGGYQKSNYQERTYSGGNYQGERRPNYQGGASRGGYKTRGQSNNTNTQTNTQ